MSFAARLTRTPIPYEPERGADAAALFGGLPPEVREVIAGAAGSSPYLDGLLLRERDWAEAALAGTPEDALAAELAAVAALEGDALSAAIRRVMDGHSVVDEEMTSKLIAAVRSSASPEPAIAIGAAQPMGHGAHAASLVSLSPRETDIMRAIGGGASNKEIARALGIAESTVKIHVQHVLRKFEVGSRVQLAVIAHATGLEP